MLVRSMQLPSSSPRDHETDIKRVSSLASFLPELRELLFRFLTSRRQDGDKAGHFCSSSLQIITFLLKLTTED